jgi:hypothetical protein
MADDLQNLAKIFNNRLFRIPDYQRGYAWGERQLADFWSDLQQAGTDRTHYCGQLTVEKADEDAWRLWDGDTWLIEEAGYKPYFIVDGQQRVTTAVILLQCLLERLQGKVQLAGRRVSELRELYLAKGDKVLRSCLFGYAKDNPSHEFFRTQILGVPSNDYRGVRTVYTNNLANAMAYFRKQLEACAGPGDRERILKALTQRFLFNLHELKNDIDVFVAFETMNNRGKPLSRLEQLKNRLIYLSTLAKGTPSERQKVRSNINAVWRTVYEELGKKADEPLDDDEFLRAHWIIFFGFDKEEPDPLTRFLLNKHFTTERTDRGELTLENIQEYANSLQASAQAWQQLHFPEDHEKTLGQGVTAGLVRLKRLGFGILRPLLLAVMCRRPHVKNEKVVPAFIQQAERFQLLVRGFARKRSDVAEAESYRLARDIHREGGKVYAATSMLRDRVGDSFSVDRFQAEVNDLFKDEDQKGFYALPDIRFVLFEYEERLRAEAKVAAAKVSWDRHRPLSDSVEHVYPQKAEDDKWPLFANFPPDKKRILTHTLGNLVLVSVARNASLSRRSFKDKKQGTPGYRQGSFSELEIAKCSEWTPSTIRDRGLKLLGFIEERWGVSLGDGPSKTRLLNLDFDLNPDTAREDVNVVLTREGRVKRSSRTTSVKLKGLPDGDEVVTVVPASTFDCVVFVADNGTAHTIRVQDVPASSGPGEPIASLIRLPEGVRVIGAVTTDERFTPPDGEAGAPYLLAATASGRVLRTPLGPFRSPTSKGNRRYIRLAEGDKVVLACLLRGEQTMFLVSAEGRVLYFPTEQVSVLSGESKGVKGIKLADGDVCLGGQPVSASHPFVTVETNSGKSFEFTQRRYEVVNRGGPGFRGVMRSRIVRVVPEPVRLPDWGEDKVGDRKKALQGG